MKTTLPRSGVALKIGPTRYSSGGILRFGRYRSGEIAIEVVNAAGEPELKATVSVVPYGAPMPGEHGLYIKNWSENEGILDALVEAGVIELTGHVFCLGHVQADHAILTEKWVAALGES